MGMKEEASTLPDTFTCFEAIVTIQLNGQALYDVIGGNIVHCHDFQELFALMKDNFGVDLHLQFFVSVLLLCLDLSLAFFGLCFYRLTGLIDLGRADRLQFVGF